MRALVTLTTTAGATVRLKPGRIARVEPLARNAGALVHLHAPAESLAVTQTPNEVLRRRNVASFGVPGSVTAP